MRDKVSNFIYLYVLWECILYLVIRVVSHHVQGYPPLENLRMLSLLWNPLFNIWFLYALALAFLLAWCLRTAPAWAVLVGALAVYCCQRRDRPVDRVAVLSSGWSAFSRSSGWG